MIVIVIVKYIYIYIYICMYIMYVCVCVCVCAHVCMYTHTHSYCGLYIYIHLHNTCMHTQKPKMQPTDGISQLFYLKCSNTVNNLQVENLDLYLSFSLCDGISTVCSIVFLFEMLKNIFFPFLILKICSRWIGGSEFGI